MVFPKDLFYWLALNRISVLGPVSIKNLIDQLGSAEAAFKTSGEKLSEIISPKMVEGIVTFKDTPLIEKELKVIEKEKISILTYRDKDYPPRLKEIASAPPLLFIKGNPACLLEGDWLGVVGSRKATQDGRRACRQLVKELSSSGIRIASGLAFGIDITAHEAVLEAGGITAAVLGGGLGRLYPSQHRRQAEKIIATGGALVSEFNPLAHSLPEFFPRRNRIISGLSRGVLVVEAAIKSGAMITTKYAAEQNRDIFAVPGPIFSEQSAGCHQLIQQGAKLVTRAADILEEWHYPVPRAVAQVPLADPKEASVFRLCQNMNPVTPDEIIEQTGLKPAQVFALLTKLELGGRVKELPGKRYLSL